LHISSIKRPEVEVAAVKRADLVVLHSNDGTPIHLFTKGVTIPEKAENKGWMLAGEIEFDRLPTLPQLIAGLTPGRTRSDQVTCFLNNIASAINSPRWERWSIAKRARRGSVASCRPIGSPRTSTLRSVLSP